MGVRTARTSYVQKVVKLAQETSRLESPCPNRGGCAWEVLIGGSVSQKIRFWWAAPVVQPSESSQAAVTLGTTDNGIGRLPLRAASTASQKSRPSARSARNRLMMCGRC
jgi:hypothetical protein